MDLTPERRALLARRTDHGLLLAGLFAAAILGKLVVEQVILRPSRLAVATRIIPGEPPEEGEPGPIYTTDGALLARSIVRHAICANPKAYATNAEREYAAEHLARVTGIPRHTILPRLCLTKRSFCYIRRQAPPAIVAAVQSLDLDGVFVRPEYARVYPQGALAANVLGRRGLDNTGLTGIEHLWGFCLDGRPSSRRSNVDAHGQTIIGLDSDVIPAEPGRRVILTLRLPLQQVAEAAMDDLYARHRPVAATCTVLDPRTGEILAAAARPTFNPNDARAAGPEDFLCRPAFDVYEPGSTFKPAIIGVALDAGAITPTTTFHCAGHTVIGARPLKCWGDWAGNGGHGAVDPAQIIAQSCNLGAAQVALRLDKTALHGYLDRMHLFETLSSGLDSEQVGAVPPFDHLRRRDQANIGFGHGVSLTDLHLLGIYGAIANGGSYQYPNIVREVRSADGTLIRRRAPLAGGRLFRQGTAARLLGFLEGSVEHGTAACARIPGVRVGGKTGTAQIFDWRSGRFVEDQYVMSFVGVAPIESPRFVVLVRVDRPVVGEHGSDTAGPTTRRVLDAALRLGDAI